MEYLYKFIAVASILIPVNFEYIFNVNNSKYYECNHRREKYYLIN